MSWEPWIEAISAEVTARPRRSGPAALQRTSTARRSGSKRRVSFTGFGVIGSGSSDSGRKGRECAGSPWRSRARTPKIRASTLERSMLSPHTRRESGRVERTDADLGRTRSRLREDYSRKCGSAGKERGGHARGGELTRRLGEARGGEGRGVIGGAPGRHGGSTYLCRDSACERCESDIRGARKRGFFASGCCEKTRDVIDFFTFWSGYHIWNTFGK